jgi:hypothetical protein
VLQTPALSLNPEGLGTLKLVTRFKFAPLTEASDIRLFKFSKVITLGAQTAFFSCEIFHANLDENLVYTAGSYVWGTLDDVVPVLVGEDHFLMVTRNLMEVLFQFSGCNNPTDAGNTIRLLWTDQLCINQYDAEERGKQVAMMKRIFNQAERTLWLGEEDEIATQAYELIKCFQCIPTTTLINPVMFALSGLDAEEIRRRFSCVFPQAFGRIPPVSDPR